MNLESGALTRLTQAGSGIAGLTGSSPALSVAADAAAVSVYDGGAFSIHVLALSAGTPAVRSLCNARTCP